MTKEIGASAGLLALLGLLVHMQLPHSDTGPDGQPRGGSDAASRKDPDSRDQKKEDLEGPWLATEAFLHAAAASRQGKEAPAIGPLVDEITKAGGNPNEIHLKELLGFPNRLPSDSHSQEMWFSTRQSIPSQPS
jgi:hypothetical protein